MQLDAPLLRSSSDDPLAEALARHFGFDAFQPGQRDVIADVLAGRPTLAVMPTGAGKSLCYQLPALVLEGVTVVVSPLIALMKDQVDALRARGIAADFVNSSQPPDEQRAALERIAAGATRLVYVAPERFRHGAFLRALERARIALFAVDEAHCISRWGHDFRPDYTRLDEALERLEPARVLACTATATAEVRADIVRALGLADPAVHVAGFLRRNLFLEARACAHEGDRARRLVELLRDGPGATGSVVVYASTRKRVERYAAELAGALPKGAVVAYHAGMPDAARALAQDRFMSGAARVAVATNAFGMGVDRADVRAVVHVDLPRTLEGYYQEVGRAGRDGEPAHCLLLHHPSDIRVHEFLIDQAYPPADALAALWEALQAAGEAGTTQAALAAEVPALEGEGGVGAALRVLMRADAVQTDATGRVRAWPDAPLDFDDLGLDTDEAARRRDAERARLRTMRRFATEGGCRHAFVLRYFGEAFPGPCPGCDACRGPRPSRDGPPGERETVVVRKALAGVARTDGRYGLRKVAAMLAGARNAEVTRVGLDQLTTFGVLRSLGAEGCLELLHHLVDGGLCRIAGDEYPVLGLTPAGRAVMLERAPSPVRLPEHLLADEAAPARRAPVARRRPGEPAPRPERSAGADPDETPLHQALRAFRREEATRLGVPPYVVFPDKTLLALVELRPETDASLAVVPGFGPARRARYGDRILEIVRTFD